MVETKQMCLGSLGAQACLDSQGAQVCLGSPEAQASLDSQGAQVYLDSQGFLSMFLHSHHLEKLWVSYNCFLLVQVFTFEDTKGR